MRITSETVFIGNGMPLYQVATALIASILIGIVLGTVASNLSYDFDNYVKYALQIELAAARFSREPLFVYFLNVSKQLQLPAVLTVQLFTIAAATVSVFAVIILSSPDGKWMLLRAFLAILLALPFLIFGLMVPRQGFATGLVLLALAAPKKFGLGPLLAVGMASITHMPTAALGFLIILFSCADRQRLVYLFLLILSLLSLILLYSELGFFSFPTGYLNYLGDFRPTGFFRMAFFMGIALFYLASSRLRTPGIFGCTPITNLLFSSFFAFSTVILYFGLFSDAVRFTYIIGIAMIVDISRRITPF